MNKLILGTANFNNNYGYENQTASNKFFDPTSLLQLAINNGIKNIDTAIAYENAHSAIGQNSKTRNMFLTTKLSRNDCTSIENIENAIDKSLFELHRDHVTNLLIHDVGVLFDGHHDYLMPKLLDLISCGKVKNIGISAYCLDEILQTKERFPAMKIFQIPENICDRRNFDAKVLLNLSKEDNEIQVRSIFLQGLLLANPLKLPKIFSGVRQKLEIINDLCMRNNVSVLELCVNYAKSITWATGIVFGVNSNKQLLEICSAYNRSTEIDFSQFPTLDSWTLDPRNWS